MATINLGDEGIAPGDTVDPYLDDYAGGSDTVVVPEGTYEWDGGGLDTGDGEIIGAGDPGDVVFNLSSGATMDGSVDNGGTLSNIVVNGANGESKSGINTPPGATVDEFIWGAGGQQDEDRAFYSPDGGEERMTIRNSLWANLVSDGAYVDKPPVLVENCVSINNNVSGIRIGHRDGTPSDATSYVRNCLVACVDDIENDSINSSVGRGLRMRHPGHFVIENCWFVYLEESSGAANPVELHDEAEGSTVELRNCHFHNETSEAVFRVKGDETQSSLTVEDCTFSGGGSMEFEMDYDGNGLTVDDSVVVPYPSEITGVPQADDTPRFDPSAGPFDPDYESPEPSEPIDDGSGDDGSTDEPTGPDTSDWDTFEIISQQTGGMDYEFTTDGRVEMTDTSAQVTTGSGDAITDNGDGTYTVTGSTGNVGYGDAYLLEGSITSYSQTPTDHDVDLLLNGNPWDDGSEPDDGTEESPDDGTDEDTSDGSEDDSTDDGGSDNPTLRTIEETESGYRMIARTQLMYFGPNNRFVSREDFIAARNEEIRNE